MKEEKIDLIKTSSENKSFPTEEDFWLNDKYLTCIGFTHEYYCCLGIED